MTRQRFLAKQQCVENVIVVDALDVTRNRAVSLDCACSAEIVYYLNSLKAKTRTGKPNVYYSPTILQNT